MGLDFENEEYSGDLNFSTPPRELSNPNKQSRPYEFEGREIRGRPGVSIGEFMEDKRDRFLSFCLDTRTGDKGTREGYYTALSGMTDTYVPNDLVGKTLTKTQIRGLSKFYRFIDEDILYKDGFNGYTQKQWRGNQQRTKNNYGSRVGQKTKDLDPEEVRTARDCLNPAVQVFYTLTGYSGGRFGHLYSWLESKDKKIEHINGIIRADVRDLSAGTKNEAYFYFPKELEMAILTYQHPYSLDYMGKLIGKAGVEGRPVNESSLRKWNFNILLDHMDRLYANAVQGRAAEGVDAAHYFDDAGKAAKWYPSALTDLSKGLPIPDWMKEGVWDMPMKKTGVSKGGKGKSRIDDAKQKEIHALLKKGHSEREIAKTLKCGRATVQKIKKELLTK